MTVCTSCKTSCNVLSHSYVINKGLDRSNSALGGVRRGGHWLLIFRGAMKKRESPDFRFPEVDSSKPHTVRIN